MTTPGGPSTAQAGAASVARPERDRKQVEYRYDPPELLTLVKTSGDSWVVWDKPYEEAVAEMSERVTRRGGDAVEVAEVCVVDRSVISAAVRVQQTTWLEPEPGKPYPEAQASDRSPSPDRANPPSPESPS